MSTNKTENYKLHTWEPSDHFLRTEFNENFAKLDQAVRMTFGTYTGNTSGTQKIALGFRPEAVLILTDEGLPLNGNNFIYGGMAGQGFPVKTTALVLDNTGFTVSNVYSKHYLNEQNCTYYYVALY